MDIFENDTRFKKNVGDFILTFSEIEFSLAVMYSKLEVGLDIGTLNPKYFGASFDEKRKKIRKLLVDKKSESLLKNWDKLNSKISECNEFRRSLAHGIVMNHIVNPSIQTLIKHKDGFILKDISNDDLMKYLTILYDVNSGKEGIGFFMGELNEWLKQKDNP